MNEELNKQMKLRTFLVQIFIFFIIVHIILLFDWEGNRPHGRIGVLFTHTKMEMDRRYDTPLSLARAQLSSCFFAYKHSVQTVCLLFSAPYFIAYAHTHVFFLHLCFYQIS